MRVLTYSALCLFVAGCIHGCAYADPATRLSINPVTRTISFSDTKDNDVSVEYVGYNADTKQFEVKNFVLRNNSSDVREIDVQQMLAFVEQQKAANDGIKAAFEGLSHTVGILGEALAGTIRAVPPIQAQVSTPVGGGSVAVGSEAVSAPAEPEKPDVTGTAGDAGAVPEVGPPVPPE
jgi:hypothetical protein